MVENETERPEAMQRDIQLDPFAHLPGVSSRIAGLGGAAPAPDATYVFHTDYVGVAPGKAEFTVRFEGLTAKQGSLVLRVHMLAQEEGAHALLATSMRVQLNRLVAQDGLVVVGFEAFRGIDYALYGSLPGDSDVAATGLTITLDRPAGIAEDAVIAVDPRNTAFGQKVGRPTPRLISLAAPTLADPVSQICTARQLREPVAREWSRTLGLGEADGNEAERWTTIYVAQVLSRFGMLAPGARGLAFASASDPLVAESLARGASLVVIDPAATEPVRVASPSLEIRAAPPGSLPGDVVSFDFAWSRDVLGAAGSAAGALRILEDVFARLRPGGLSVHTLPFNLDSHEDTIERGELVLYRRRDLERFALTFISHGHEAAQIKIDAADAPEQIARNPLDGISYRATMAGFITRKAASLL